MSFAVHCPECGSGLEVEEEHRDWTVRCPNCRHEFRPSSVSPSAPAPVPADTYSVHHDDPDDDEPRPKRRRRRDPDDDDDDDDYGYDDRAHALKMVSGPATALKVVGWIGVVLSLLGLGIWVLLLLMVLGAPQGANNPGGPQRDEVLTQAAIYIPQSIVACGVSIVMLIGAGKMGRLESHGWAQAAAIVGMVPCISPCCLLGLPFGIWALNTINNPDVKRAFRTSRRYD